MIRKLLNIYKLVPVQAKVVLWFTFGSFLQKGVSIITTPIFTRILSPNDYGMFSVYNSWSELLIIIITLHLHMAVMNNAFMKMDTSKETIVSSFQGLSLTTTLVFSFLYLLCHHWLDPFIGLPFPIIFAMFISFIFIPPYNYWMIYNRYQYNYKQLTTIPIAIAIITPICGLIGIYLAGDCEKGAGRIYGKIAVTCIVGIIFMIINWSKDHTFYHKSLWKYALCFNLPLVPHFLSETFLNQSDRIMINYYYGTAEAGFYSIAFTVASLMQIFSSAVNTAMVPWQYEQLKAENYRAMASPIYSILVGLGAASALMIILAPEIVHILAGEKYTSAINLIPMLSASVFFNYLYQTLARVEMYYGKRIYTVIGTFSTVIVNVILNYLWIPKYGFIAAGYSTLLSHILLCVMHYYFYRIVCINNIGGTLIFNKNMLLLISTAIILIAIIMTFLYDFFVIRFLILFISLGTIVFLIYRKFETNNLLKE